MTSPTGLDTTGIPEVRGRRAPLRLSRPRHPDSPRPFAYGGTGWYGHDTFQVILWRTDLVEVIDPA